MKFIEVVQAQLVAIIIITSAHLLNWITVSWSMVLFLTIVFFALSMVSVVRYAFDPSHSV